MNKKHRDLQLSEKAFNVMKSNYHNEWIKLEKLYNSKHDKAFIELAKEQERSHMFVPLAKSTLDILEAVFVEAFFSVGNPISITKNEIDEADIASCLNVLVDHYYTQSKPYISLSMAFSSAARFGLGAVLPYWDKTREIPITRFVPATKVAFDTEALTRDEIQYTSYKFKQTKQDITQKVKDKFYDKLKVKDLDSLLGSKYTEDSQKYKRVTITEVYTLQTNDKYMVRTFVKNVLAREVEFKSCPLKTGYMTAVLPTIDETLQDKQSAGVGESMLGNIKEIVKEVNQKRNQIVDLHEQLIDPYTMVGDESDIAPDDAGKIKGVVNVGDPSKVKRFSPTNTFPIEKEIAMCEKDLEDVTAVNSMQRGETSSSDRRAAAAMAMINANSSSRLSKKATTINDTLFTPWAEAFVNFIYVNTPDAVIDELFGSNPLGVLGSRQEMEYVVNVNFGQSINKNEKVQELTTALQMLNGRQDADVMPILSELLKLILGDAFDVNSIFKGVLGAGGDKAVSNDVGGQEGGTPGDSQQGVAGATKGSINDSSTESGNTNDAQYDGVSQNQI